jgi:hypothetical protein
MRSKNNPENKDQLAGKWIKLPSKDTIDKTIAALKANNIDVYLVNSKEEAKAKALSLIPKNASVLTMTSVTLKDTGIADEINGPSVFNSIRNKLTSMDETQRREMKSIGASPEYAIGSVNAVTQQGEVLVASATGSQIPAYAYGSDHVIWVVSTAKIVDSLDSAMKRIYEYVLPLESERAKKAYGAPGSSVNKILIVNKEHQKNRFSLIFVNEILGY